MTFNVKNIIKKLFLEKNITFGRVTPLEKLTAFLLNTRPLNTNFPLIRIGSLNDGGYLVPDDLSGIVACFSPGVAKVADFENQITKKNIPCFLADYSVECPHLKNTLFDFERRFLGQQNNEKYMTLANWVKRKAPEHGDLILQMDIEGAEYAVLLDSDNELLKRFRILIIEFHNFEGLLHSRNFELINIVFQKLLKNFAVVHIHPNNFSATTQYHSYEIPSDIEYTFLRNDRILNSEPAAKFPHTLDAKNNVNSKTDLELPTCFYRF
jgi:hypothetical protein